LRSGFHCAPCFRYPMSSLTLDSRVTIPQTVVPRAVGDEVVLMNLDSGVYSSLDAVGGRMWELLAENGQLRPAYEVLRREYRVEPEALQRDLLELVRRLVDKGLLVLAESPSP
jgi:hypothetical protein